MHPRVRKSSNCFAISLQTRVKSNWPLLHSRTVHTCLKSGRTSTRTTVGGHVLADATVDMPPDGENTVPIAEQPGDPIGRYKLLRADRRRRIRHGVDGGADRAGAAPRGAEDHQAGHGHAGGHRALRAGAAGAGDDGSSEHRAGARRRRDGAAAGRSSSWNWCAGIQITEYCDRAPPGAFASGWSFSCTSARPCNTRTRKGSFIATSSRRTFWSRSTTASRCRR